MALGGAVRLEHPKENFQLFLAGGDPANPGSHDVVVSNGQIAHRGQLIALGNIRNSGGVQVVFPGGHAQGVGISDLFLSDHVHKSDGHHSAFGGAAGQENGRLFEVVDPLDAVVIQHEILIIRHAGMERFPVSCHSIVIGGIFLSINSDNAVIALNPQTVALQRPGTVNQAGGQRLMALGGAVHLQVPQEALQLVILGGDPADGDRDNTIFNQQVAGPGQLIVFGDPLGVNLGGVHVVGVGIHSHGVSAADFPIGHLVKEADRDVSRDALEHCGKGNISFTVIPEHMLNHVGQSSICGQCAIGIAVIIPTDELIAVLGDGLQDGIVGVILLRHGYGVRLYTFQPIKVALCIVDLVAHRERAVLLDKDRKLAVLGSGRISIILRKHVSRGRGEFAQHHGLIVGGNGHAIGAALHFQAGLLIHKHDLEGRLLGFGFLLAVDGVEDQIAFLVHIVPAIGLVHQLSQFTVRKGFAVIRSLARSVKRPAGDLLVTVARRRSSRSILLDSLRIANRGPGFRVTEADLDRPAELARLRFFLAGGGAVVGDAGILRELLIQLRTRIGLDGGLVGQLAVLNIIAVKVFDNIDLGAAARGNGTEDLIGTAGTAVASHHTGTRIGDLKFCVRGAGHGQLVQQGDLLAVGDDHGILIVHGRAIQREVHISGGLREPHLGEAGNEGVPVGKIGSTARQAARLTCDLSSAFCRGVPPVKRIARAGKAEGVTFHRVAHRRSAGVGGLPDELGFDGCTVSRALVAVIVYLNGIPDRVRGRGTGHARRARLIPDLHRVGQAGSLTGIRVRGYAVSSREGRGLFTFNGNTAGIAAGIDDAVLVGHFGRSSRNPIIGQQIRNIIGLFGIGVVGNSNRPGHPVTLVEDGVAHRICQLHRLLVPHHAGQRLGYGDGFGGLGVLNNNSKVDSLLIPIAV